MSIPSISRFLIDKYVGGFFVGLGIATATYTITWGIKVKHHLAQTNWTDVLKRANDRQLTDGFTKPTQPDSNTDQERRKKWALSKLQ